MRAFNVYLAGKKIDTVFYSGQGTATVGREEVRTSLVTHDGYDPGITVRENHKMTKHTEFVIQGSYGQGWEDENTELTRADGVRSLREYRENMPQYPHRMITRTVEKDWPTQRLPERIRPHSSTSRQSSGYQPQGE